MTGRRWLETAVAGVFLTGAALPFAVFFPEPPAFGPEVVAIAAAAGILASLGMALRATPARRRSMLRGAALLLGLTVGATAIHILRVRDLATRIPTADLLATLFGLQGEDIDDAVLYEEWVELWLGCSLVVFAAMSLSRTLRRHLRATPVRTVADPWSAPAPTRRWNAATVALCLVGVAVLVAAVLDGHRTADFLSRATHAVGTVADPRDHPRIRFMTADGTTVEFTQDGAVSRPLGAAVPVAYLAADPSGTARANTFWAVWSDVLGLLWIGLGFTVGPFWGARAVLRGARR